MSLRGLDLGNNLTNWLNITRHDRSSTEFTTIVCISERPISELHLIPNLLCINFCSIHRTISDETHADNKGLQHDDNGTNPSNNGHKKQRRICHVQNKFLNSWLQMLVGQGRQLSGWNNRTIHSTEIIRSNEPKYRLRKMFPRYTRNSQWFRTLN